MWKPTFAVLRSFVLRTLEYKLGDLVWLVPLGMNRSSFFPCPLPL